MEEGRDLVQRRAADREVQRLERRRGVWPGPEPSPFSQQSMTHPGASILAQPVTVPPLQAEPALVSAFILQSPTRPSQVWVYARKSVIWVSRGRDRWSRHGQKPDTHTGYTGNQGHRPGALTSVQGDEGKPVQEVEGPKSMRAALNPTVCVGWGGTRM